MIQIHGLNLAQRKMCDKIWSMDGTEELMEWFDSLTMTQKFQAYCMIELISLEVMEQDELGDMKQARSLINRIRKL